MSTAEPFVVIVELNLLPDVSGEAAKQLVSRNAAASLRNEPGCLRFDVVEIRDEGAAFMLYEIYANEHAFAEHLKTPHFQEFDRASERYFGTRKVRLGGLCAETLIIADRSQDT